MRNNNKIHSILLQNLRIEAPYLISDQLIGIILILNQCDLVQHY